MTIHNPFLSLSLSLFLSRYAKVLTAIRGNTSSLHFFPLATRLDRGAWQSTVHGVAELDTTECTHTYIHTRLEVYPGLGRTAVTQDTVYRQKEEFHEARQVPRRLVDDFCPRSTYAANSAFLTGHTSDA